MAWTTRPEKSDELRAVTTTIRDLVGSGARPTVCFERGGWTPSQFAELTATGFDVVAYGNGRASAEPDAAFGCHRFTDESGCSHDYLLADREVHVAYHGGRRRFSCRQITHLDARSGHQTPIITTRRDADPATVAHAMSDQLSLGPIDHCMRTRLGRRDDAAATTAPTCWRPSVAAFTTSCAWPPARRSPPSPAASSPISLGPATPLGLLREVFRSPADVLLVGDELHVRLESCAAQPSARAIAALCDDLTSTATRYPATDLKLVYSMGGDRCDAACGA